MKPSRLIPLVLAAMLACLAGCKDSTATVSGLNGTPFDDVIIGSSNDDFLRGFAGNDLIDGRGGNDILEGGSGADDLDGSTGLDTATYQSSSSGVEVDLTDTFQSFGHASGDHLESIENITGSGAGDILRGDAIANVLMGGQGDDELIGRDGDDDLDGGNGDDQLEGGQGQDTVRGGAGNDNLQFDSADFLIDGGAGDDTLLILGNLVLAPVVGLLRDFEVLNLQDSSSSTLTIDPDDLEDISDNRLTLRIDGDTGDAVQATLPATWILVSAQPVTLGGADYLEYAGTTSGLTSVTLYVATNLGTSGL